jgi:hypothetical protein
MVSPPTVVCNSKLNFDRFIIHKFNNPFLKFILKVVSLLCIAYNSFLKKIGCIYWKVCSPPKIRKYGWPHKKPDSKEVQILNGNTKNESDTRMKIQEKRIQDLIYLFSRVY